MKKFIVFGTILMLLFIFTGCGKDKQDLDNIELSNGTDKNKVEEVEKNNDYREDLKKDSKAQDNEIKENMDIDNEDINKEEDTENKQEKNPTVEEVNNKENNEQQNIQVIAKSNSGVTSKEKEEILNEIDKLLDDMLNNINNMDSVEDEDLTLEN